MSMSMFPVLPGEAPLPLALRSTASLRHEAIALSDQLAELIEELSGRDCAPIADLIVSRITNHV